MKSLTATHTHTQATADSLSELAVALQQRPTPEYFACVRDAIDRHIIDVDTVAKPSDAEQLLMRPIGQNIGSWRCIRR